MIVMNYTNETVNEKLCKACGAAVEAFKKLGSSDYSQIQDELEYVIGSYGYDNVPTGLHLVGKKALKKLKAIKEEKPRAVTKKVIDDVSKAVLDYEEVYF